MRAYDISNSSVLRYGLKLQRTRGCIIGRTIFGLIIRLRRQRQRQRLILQCSNATEIQNTLLEYNADRLRNDVFNKRIYECALNCFEWSVMPILTHFLRHYAGVTGRSTLTTSL